jgi:glyoxylase-like metal-dependent hydrolase (beta-lactamase superfamily II)
MQRIIIEPNLWLYQFPPLPKRHWAINVCVLVNGSDALLMDTGYEKNGADVLADLQAQGLTPRQVVLSHFHDDHLLGLKSLPPVELLGSEDYRKTFDLYFEGEDVSLYIPQHKLHTGSTHTFGSFQLRFLVRPGHALCNTYTIINERYIQVGDDVMLTNQGEAILPWVEFSRVADHIASLEMLKEYSHLTFLPSHGSPLSGQEKILADLDNRLAFLRAVQSGQGKLDYAQASQNCTGPFLHSEWHEKTYMVSE